MSTPIVSDLTKTCVFLKITLSRLGDKKGVSSEDITVDADKEFVKARKIIFKSGAFDSIKSLDSEIRRYVRDQCLPFDPGIHLVPLAMVEKIETRLNEYFERRQELISVFAKIYPHLKMEFEGKLRKLYDAKDYEEGDIRDEFLMYWQYLMFTAPTELEAVSIEAFQREKEKWSERMEQAYWETRQVLRETALEMVRHLRDRLENDQFGAPKRLAATSVTHLLEFTENYRRFYRDVTNDTELTQYMTDVQRLLSGIPVESLREEEGLRARVRGELAHIEEAIDKSVETAPRRRIRVA